MLIHVECVSQVAPLCFVVEFTLYEEMSDTHKNSRELLEGLPEQNTGLA